MLLDEVCSDTAEERCTTEKRNDLLGPEPTTEPVTSCLCVPVPSTQKPETKGPTREASLSSGNCPSLSGKLSDSDSDHTLDKRRCVKSRSLV